MILQNDFIKYYEKVCKIPGKIIFWSIKISDEISDIPKYKKFLCFSSATNGFSAFYKTKTRRINPNFVFDLNGVSIWNVRCNDI